MTFYRVTFRPFKDSDLISTQTCSGTDEKDVRTRWEKQYPLWQIVSIEEDQ